MSIKEELFGVVVCGFCIAHMKSFTITSFQAASGKQGLGHPAGWQKVIEPLHADGHQPRSLRDDSLRRIKVLYAVPSGQELPCQLAKNVLISLSIFLAEKLRAEWIVESQLSCHAQRFLSPDQHDGFLAGQPTESWLSLALCCTWIEYLLSRIVSQKTFHQLYVQCILKKKCSSIGNSPRDALFGLVSAVNSMQ